MLSLMEQEARTIASVVSVVPPSNQRRNRGTARAHTTDARLSFPLASLSVWRFSETEREDLRLSLSNKFASPNEVNHRFCGVKVRINSIRWSLHGLFFCGVRIFFLFCVSSMVTGYAGAKMQKINLPPHSFDERNVGRNGKNGGIP